MRAMKCVVLLIALALLWGCGKQTVPETRASTAEPITSVKMIVTEDTIHDLEDYPALERADLRGSSCYAAILNYQHSHPQVDTLYDVAFGSTRVDSKQTALELNAKDADFEALKENLTYLPALENLMLRETELTQEEILELRGAYPELKLTYTVALLGQELAWDTETLDLSSLQEAEVEGVSGKLSLLPALQSVELMDAEGNTTLTPKDVAALQTGTEAHFHYVFELFGKQVSTDDERIEFKNKRLGENTRRSCGRLWKFCENATICSWKTAALTMSCLPSCGTNTGAGRRSSGAFTLPSRAAV